MNLKRVARALCLVGALALVTAVAAYASSDDGGGAPSTAATAKAEAKPGPADRAAIRGLLDKIGRAWKDGDAKAYASFHTRNADLIDFRGTHAVGRKEIVALLQPLFDGVLKGTRVKARPIGLRFLAPNVAIMHSIGQIVPVGGNSIQTFVATKGKTGWLIASFQNTRIGSDDE